MDRGAWWATAHGITESDTAERTHRPTWGKYLVGKITWLIPSSPLLESWESLFQETIPPTLTSITGSCNRDLKEKTLQENNLL